jgi:hypothetical protein
MKLKILQVQNKGSAADEYVLLEALADCCLNHYLIADTTYGQDGVISNKKRHLYWFPHISVKQGQRIILHSGHGKDRVCTSLEGETTHDFYWNQNTPVWNNRGDAALLFQLEAWSHTEV